MSQLVMALVLLLVERDSQRASFFFCLGVMFLAMLLVLVLEMAEVIRLAMVVFSVVCLMEVVPEVVVFSVVCLLEVVPEVVILVLAQVVLVDGILHLEAMVEVIRLVEALLLKVESVRMVEVKTLDNRKWFCESVCMALMVVLLLML
jgi:hypothetical protein